MLSLKNVLPNFLRSAVFVAAIVFSFGAAADDHGDAPVVEEAVEAEAADAEAAVEAEAEAGDAALDEAKAMVEDAVEGEAESMMPSK